METGFNYVNHLIGEEIYRVTVTDSLDIFVIKNAKREALFQIIFSHNTDLDNAHVIIAGCCTAEAEAIDKAANLAKIIRKAI